jgi:hypothetical protein
LGPLSFGAGVESLVGFDAELVLSVDSPVEGFSFFSPEAAFPSLFAA